MIVCHCKGITDREIRRAIRDGANSTREISLACHAARECGGCRPVIAELLARETERTSFATHGVAPTIASTPATS